jgi:hypothetical protein
MGPLSIHILGDSDDALIKVVVTVFVLIIWGISATVSAAKKARTAAQQRRARAGVAPAYPVTPMRAVALPPLPKPSRRPAMRQAPVPPPIPVSRALPTPPPPAPARTPGRASLSAASGSAITPISTLMTADTIRSQFILAEIFQPPVALRRRRSL